MSHRADAAAAALRGHDGSVQHVIDLKFHTNKMIRLPIFSARHNEKKAHMFLRHVPVSAHVAKCRYDRFYYSHRSRDVDRPHVSSRLWKSELIDTVSDQTFNRGDGAKPEEYKHSKLEKACHGKPKELSN